MGTNTSKTVVITGGTKGIGQAIAEEFYQIGYHVVVGSRQDSGLSQRLGDRCRFVQMDVREEGGHNLLAQAAIDWTSRLDVYINCAGFSKWRSIDNVDNNFWEEMIGTNLKGSFWGCKVAAQHMSRGCSIINVSSLAGKRGSSNNSVYCASKFGVTGLTQSLAKELGAKGVRVNAVCPVYVQTDGLMEALKDKVAPPRGNDTDAYLKQFTQTQTALGQLPEARDVAQLCVFLASDAAKSITGQSINVDCGVLPQ